MPSHSNDKGLVLFRFRQLDYLFGQLIPVYVRHTKICEHNIEFTLSLREARPEFLEGVSRIGAHGESCFDIRNAESVNYWFQHFTIVNFVIDDQNSTSIWKDTLSLHVPSDVFVLLLSTFLQEVLEFRVFDGFSFLLDWLQHHWRRNATAGGWLWQDSYVSFEFVANELGEWQPQPYSLCVDSIVALDGAK